MVLDDDNTPRVFRPLRAQAPPPFTPLLPLFADEWGHIRTAALDHPEWGPKRIEAWLRHQGHTIPLDVIRAALTEPALQGGW